MLFVDEIKTQIDIMMHPGKIKNVKSIRDALSYYYKVAIIPMILFIILGVALHNSGALGQAFSGLGANAGIALTIGFAILIFLVLEPIGIFIDAALFQLFGKYLFKVYKGRYTATFTGVMYGVSTIVLFYWLTVIPVVGSVLLLIFAIWALIVQIIGISKLQKISRMASLGVVIGTVIIVLIVVVILTVAVAGAAGL